MSGPLPAFPQETPPAAPRQTPPPPDGTTGDSRKTFAPGVTIDWQRKAVEVAAAVVLREGPLELFACSPRTREHESILRVDARPLDIFKAIGLVGIEPGKPVHYDEKKDAWLPPSGEPVDLRITCEQDGRRRTVAAADWLLDVERKAPPTDVAWVFAGSTVFEGDHFGADVDGTVVSVVDFTSALIAITGLHTADNESLWLSANTEAIPPVGTKCVLTIRSAAAAVVAVTLAADGKLTHDGKPITVADLAARLRADDASVEIRVAADLAEPVIAKVSAELVAAGVAPAAIRVLRAEREAPAKPVTPP